MAVLDTNVIYLHSGMTGAPSMTGATNGYAAVAVLDACLVNGFNSQTITTLAVASNIATLTKASHGYEAGAVINISGASPAGFNGNWRIATVTANTLTYEMSGVADQTATGTITAKYAGANWEKSHSGTGLAAYKGLGAGSLGFKLRVDDTGTTSARVVGYESMTDINTNLVGPFPTAAQISGGGFLSKSGTNDSTARTWIFVGDGRAFYLNVQYNTTAGYFHTVYFGDFNSIKAADGYACAICCASASAVSTTSPTTDFGYSTTTTGLSGNNNVRGVTGFGSSVTTYKSAPTPVGAANGMYSGLTAANSLTYPNSADGGLYLVPFNNCEFMNSSYVLRGTYPGAYYCANLITNVFSPRDALTGVTGLSGRTLRAIPTSSGGFFFIDVTGPWR
ncbi:MAG TPA: hypothetical protein V6C58_21085 [Allocoleopsis sp.]